LKLGLERLDLARLGAIDVPQRLNVLDRLLVLDLVVHDRGVGEGILGVVVLLGLRLPVDVLGALGVE
jgi:hypothetical protein